VQGVLNFFRGRTLLFSPNDAINNFLNHSEAVAPVDVSWFAGQ